MTRRTRTTVHAEAQPGGSAAFQVDTLERRCAELEGKLAFAMSVASVLAATASRSPIAEPFARAIDQSAAGAARADDRDFEHAAVAAARMVRRGAAAMRMSTPIAEA